MSNTDKCFVTAGNLRAGDVLSNGRRLTRVVVPEGPWFVTVAWRSSSAKSGERKTSFAKHRNVLIRKREA